MATTNHQFENPDYESIDWHYSWYTNFEDLDTAIEIRDLEANRNDYQAKSGAKFYALDSGAEYLGNGSTWEEAPNSVGGDANFTTLTADTADIDTLHALTEFEIPRYDAFADAPDQEFSMIYITGAVDPEGLYQHDGTQYVRLGGGGTDGTGLLGGHHTATGDGTTTTFTWSTGANLGANEEFVWIGIDPSTDAASPDFIRSSSGADLSVEYASAPDNGAALGWYWMASTTVEAGGGGGGGASSLSQLTIDTSKDWGGYNITNVGDFSSATAAVSTAPAASTDVVRQAELTPVENDVSTLQTDVSSKADNPHDNTAHSTDYSAVGHDHTGESLSPSTVAASSVDTTSATVTDSPSAATDVARLSEIDDQYSLVGDTLEGSMNAGGYQISNVSTLTANVVDANQELHIPEVSGVPDSGSLWFRTDL